MTRIATAVSVTGNGKTGPTAATYAAQQSCPKGCPLRGAGCYAEQGRMNLHTQRYNGNAAEADATAQDVAQAEADAIRSMAVVRGLPMRLHVVGDCPTEETARTVAAACDDYRARKGGPAWTYTHAWEDVPRDAWGAVSALASVHDASEARAAEGRGYVPALVVEDHPLDGKAWRGADGALNVPCVEQTRGVQCVDCRLCFDDAKLRRMGARIVFSKKAHRHGWKKERNRRMVALGLTPPE